MDVSTAQAWRLYAKGRSELAFFGGMGHKEPDVNSKINYQTNYYLLWFSADDI